MSFFSELSRRNVFRVAGIYAMTGWLLLQVVDVVSPALGMPEWVDGFFVLLLMVGFPVALILAWAFEMTPEGIRITAPPGESEDASGRLARPLDMLIALGVLVVGGLSVWGALDPGERSPMGESPGESKAGDATIAVLPFADLSDTGDQEYFSDGLAEELLNALSRIDGLRVASRTATVSIKAQNLEIADIGERLRVAHLLEGSVRKSGDRLRITAQLVRVADGFQLWADSYDRQLDDVFAIQEDIAERILAELQVRVMGGGSDLRPVGASGVAYDLVARGRAAARTFAQDGWELAEALFQEAIEMEPAYAEAYFNLAEVLMLNTNSNGGSRRPIEQGLALARPHIAKGFALDPDNPRGFTTRGLYHSLAHEFDAAEQDYLRARELQPNIDLWGYKYVLEKQERWDELLAFQRIRAEENPWSYRERVFYLRSLATMGNRDEAQAELDRLEDDFAELRGMWSPRGSRALSQVAAGQYAEGVMRIRELLEESRNNEYEYFRFDRLRITLMDLEAPPASAAGALLIEGFQGDPQSGLTKLEGSVLSNTAKNFEWEAAAVLAHLSGDYSFLSTSVAANWPASSSAWPPCRHSEFPHALVVHAYRALEQFSQAEALMSCWGEWLRLREAKGVDYSGEWMRRGAFHAMAGDLDAAFDAFGRALDEGTFWSLTGFELLPQVQALQSDDRYEAFAERYYGLLNAQRHLLDLPPVPPGSWQETFSSPP